MAEKVCQRCVLPESFPGIVFDEDGICNICRSEGQIEDSDREELSERLKQHYESIRGQESYDCIVAFSGGKDSTFILKDMVENHRLNCLAVTIDNGFISEQAFKNIREVTDRLGVDQMTLKPSTLQTNAVFRKSIQESPHPAASIKRASAICNSCITMINNQVMKLALSLQIPLIAGGYLGGQVPRNAALIRLNIRARVKAGAGSLKRFEASFGREACKNLFQLPEALLSLPGCEDKTLVNPMLATRYDEDAIIKEISKLGWQRPKDTGGYSSNCLLNDLGIAAHLAKHGFHPYAMELADQVRHGFLDRNLALKKLAQPIPDDLVHRLAEKLNLSPEDLANEKREGLH